MALEIELKFLVQPAETGAVRNQLNALPHQYTAPVMLTNRYFETADNQLRRWDMGLRIRGRGDQYEMTLKTAGQTIGGLHQRPEYNIPLTRPEPDLYLLPEKVWPSDSNMSALQLQLAPLFSTDFHREKWVVTCENSEIEVALDQGRISAADKALPICELELELISGKRQDLFSLAFELVSAGGLRLGYQSKAARGYGLAQHQQGQSVTHFSTLAVPAKASAETGFQMLLSGLLKRWQCLEEQWMAGDTFARNLLAETLLALRETFTLFGGMIPRQASNPLREAILTLESRLEEGSGAELCTSGLWAHTQLALTYFIAEQSWKTFVKPRQLGRLAGSFKRFCDIMLNRTAAQLNSLVASSLSAAEVLALETRLHRLILAIWLLSCAYPQDETALWLSPWRNLLNTIKSNQRQNLLQLLPSGCHQPYWLSGNQ